MKQIKRQIDETGRIVVPKPFREMLGVNLKDYVVMYMSDSGDEIVLRKAGTECTLCGKEGSLQYRGINLCKDCIADIADQAKE